MRLQLPDSPLALRKDAPLRLIEARGGEIHALAGIVWITVEGQAEDIFLRPGEQFAVITDGLVLVEAVDRADIRLCLPVSAPAALARWLVGRARSGRQAKMDGFIRPSFPDPA